MPFGSGSIPIALGIAAYPGYSLYVLHENLETAELRGLKPGQQLMFAPVRFLGEAEADVIGVLGIVDEYQGGNGILANTLNRCAFTNRCGQAEAIKTRRDTLSAEAAELIPEALELFSEWPNRELYPQLAKDVDDEIDPIRFANILCQTVELPLDLAAHVLEVDDVGVRLNAAVSHLRRTVPGIGSAKLDTEARRQRGRRIAQFAMNATSTIAVEVLKQAATRLGGG